MKVTGRCSELLIESIPSCEQPRCHPVEYFVGWRVCSRLAVLNEETRSAMPSPGKQGGISPSRNVVGMHLVNQIDFALANRASTYKQH